MAEKQPEKPTPAAPEAKDAAAGADKKPGQRLLLAALLLLGLMIGSASAAVVVASLVIKPPPPPPEKSAAETHKADMKPCEFMLESQLIVNVYQTQQRRYLSVKPVLACDGEETQRKLKEKAAEVQHLLIGVLKTKTLEQLDDPDATNVIGREIQEVVNLKMELKNGVTSVRFIQFVVQ
jgi:flagellar FliL protein